MGRIIFSVILGLLISFILGVVLSQSYLKYITRKDRKIIKKWGVEKDLFKVGSSCRLAIYSFCCIIGLGILYDFAVPGFNEIIDDGKSYTITDLIIVTIPAVTYFCFLSAAFEYNRTKKIWEMVTRLDGLKPRFKKRLSVVELLSMYKALSVAPKIFWEDYSRLKSKQITKATNVDYRNLVEPYNISKQNLYHQITATASIPTVVFPAIVAIIISVA